MISSEERRKLVPVLTKLCKRARHPFIQWRYHKDGSIQPKGDKNLPNFTFKYYVTQDGWDENFTGKPEDDIEWLKVQTFPMFEPFAMAAMRETQKLRLRNYPSGVMYQFMEIPEGYLKRSQRNVLIYEGLGYFETEVPDALRQQEMERRRNMSQDDKRREAELMRRFRQSQRNPKQDSGLFIQD